MLFSCASVAWMKHSVAQLKDTRQHKLFCLINENAITAYNAVAFLDSPWESTTTHFLPVHACVHVMREADVCCIPDRFRGLWSTSLWYVSNFLPARCLAQRSADASPRASSGKINSFLSVVLLSLEKKCFSTLKYSAGTRLLISSKRRNSKEWSHKFFPIKQIIHHLLIKQHATQSFHQISLSICWNFSRIYSCTTFSPLIKSFLCFLWEFSCGAVTWVIPHFRKKNWSSDIEYPKQFISTKQISTARLHTDED